MSDQADSKPKEAYRVLARKYRPQHFDEVVGQDALVRTLRNAIETGRIHHAYILTGIRGTGKTTTARLIAKALNYTGADGKAGPTTGPTDDCEICRAIAEDRHPDVLEMDAASRTGVDDIREILDGVRYAPTSARYKVYIIDEVHMLSRNAFNALLKTLEEPPAHVIFIFATTEIRKVPVTVLSRCQRFDLRRVDAATLTEYYGKICEKEGVTIDGEALGLIAKAADGSVRDGLSLLDQAIAFGGDKITGQQIQDMLGLADRMRVMDVLESALTGDCAKALDLMADLNRDGADPVTVLQDMLDLTHIFTRFRAVPKMKDTHTAMAKEAVQRASDLAASLSMPSLTRAWQILLKGLGEVNMAPNPQAAAEMIVIRLAYAADLPDPGDLIKKLKDEKPGDNKDAPASAKAEAPAREPEPVALRSVKGGAKGNGSGGAVAARLAEPESDPATQTNEPVAVTALRTLPELEAALKTAGHYVLASQLYQYVHLVRLEPRVLEFRPAENAPQDLAANLNKALHGITAERWMVSVSSAPGQATLAERKEAADQALYEEIKAHPLVRNVLEIFPGATLKVQKNN